MIDVAFLSQCLMQMFSCFSLSQFWWRDPELKHNLFLSPQILPDLLSFSNILFQICSTCSTLDFGASNLPANQGKDSPEHFTVFLNCQQAPTWTCRDGFMHKNIMLEKACILWKKNQSRSSKAKWRKEERNSALWQGTLSSFFQLVNWAWHRSKHQSSWSCEVMGHS